MLRVGVYCAIGQLAVLGLLCVLGLLGALGLAGCQGVSVEARAIWLDVGRDADGSRRLNIYDRGEVEYAVVGASIADAPAMHLQLGPRGSHALLREPPGAGGPGVARAIVLDLADHRSLRFLAPPPCIECNDPLVFSGDGEAIMWGGASGLSLLPLAPGMPLAEDEDGLLKPLRLPGGDGVRWVVSATESPIVFALLLDGVTRLDLAAIRFPGAPTDTPELVELRRFRGGEGLVPELLPSVVEGCDSPSLGCEAGWVMDPQGRAMTWLVPGLAGEPASWFRWGRSSPVMPPEQIDLPSDIQDGESPRLLAALAPNVYVFRDANSLHVWDRGEGTVRSLPMLGGSPFTFRVVDRGRALLWISARGPVIRAQAQGLRVIEATRTTCPGTSPPTVSPSGDWIAWSCLDDEAASDFARGVVVRVSEGAGLERFSGIAMTPLAIDDAGSVLLTSVDDVVEDYIDGAIEVQIPHNLYALDAEGVLHRGDALEPSPEVVILSKGGLGTFLQATSLR